ncbi:MAG: histidine--tRNA ligase [Syntrophales bacterium]|nr:histidine--tRNA ligase [Syntrophales bacterium]
MTLITSLRGFKDILPDETVAWRQVETRARLIFARFGLREIRVPILEKTELFSRGIGDATDIVEKEMYTFTDRGGDSLTMRPEATASVIRSYLEHGMYQSESVSKLYTMGPMFRRERPQKGRYRQFHQINVEFLGSEDPRLDGELLFMLVFFLEDLGLPDLRLEINSLGCPACRPAFKERVREFLDSSKGRLCEDCRRRLDNNPLRVFDCKNEGCRILIDGAPAILDSLCGECEDHFTRLRGYLKALGVDYVINGMMVRGLDYYRRTAFEVTTTSLGSQNAVAGGGRYDGLTEQLGGPDIPGIGFAIGMERLISLIPDSNLGLNESPLLYIATLGEDALDFSYLLSISLKKEGITTEIDFSDRGLKSQMKRSNRLGCRFTLIIGENEMTLKKAELRDMKEGTQRSLSLENPAELALELSRLAATADNDPGNNNIRNNN